MKQHPVAFLAMGSLAVACGAQLIHAQDFSGPKVADAKPGEVRVIATAAIRQPLDEVRNEAQRVIGRPLVIEYGSARGNLKQEILAGQDFEVALLLPDVNAALLKADKILPGSFEIARDPVAVGLRGDAPPHLDVSSPESLKQVMLHAKSVKYAPTGAALDTVKKIFGTLGIASAIKDSSTLQEPVALAPGEYEINLFPISEIIPNKALINLGPVTPSLQVPVVIAAVVGKHTDDLGAARSLIKFLQGAGVDAALKEDGMEKGKP